MQAYSDPKRANDPHALPNVEVFELAAGQMQDEDGDDLPAGWYWWSCFPGCLPDSGPAGPFDTEAEAIAEAQDTNAAEVSQ